MKNLEKIVLTTLLLLIFFIPIGTANATTYSPKTSQDVPPRNAVVWNVGYQTKATNLNPWSSNPAFGIALMYEPLFGYNSVNEKYVPVIGLDFSWATDGSYIEINLNPNAKWSDGQSIDSEDVIMSYLMAKNQTAFTQDLTIRFKNFTLVDDDTVRFYANPGYEYSLVILQLISQNIPILPEHVFGEIRAQYMNKTTGDLGVDYFQNDWFDTNFNSDWKVCSGPYVPYYRSPTADEEIYQYRDNWWGAGVIYKDLPNAAKQPPKYVGLRQYEDNTAQDAAFLTGVVDCHSGYYKEIWKAMARNQFINTYYGRKFEGPYYQALSSIITLAPNHHVYPFNETWFRQVLAYAINYEPIPAAAASGYWVRAKQGFIDNNSATQAWAYDPGVQKEYGISYNVAKAISILKQHCSRSGETWVTLGNQSIPGVTLGPYEILTPSGWSDVAIATQLWAGYISNLNITTIKKEIDFGSAYIPRIESDNFDMIMQTAGNRLIHDPFTFLGGLEGTHLWNQNSSYWHNSEFVNLYQQLETTANNQTKAKEICSQMQEILAKEIPEIPTHANGFWYAFSDQYWDGWLSDENNYNQPVTVFTVQEMALKARLYLNLVPTGAQEGAIPWFGLEIFTIIGIISLVGLVGYKVSFKKK